MFGWFNNLAVKAKLLVAFSVVIVLTLVISIVSLINLSSIKGSIEYADTELSGNYNPNVEISTLVNEVNDQLFIFVSNIREFTPDNQATVEKKLSQISQFAEKIDFFNFDTEKVVSEIIKKIRTKV